VTTDQFESAKLWITQAQGDLARFESTQAQAVGAAQFQSASYVSGDKKYWVVRSREQPPQTLRTEAANILNALRSALDQATWKASVLLGADEGTPIYFPFAGNKTAFDNLFKEKGAATRTIPSELHPFLQSLQSYPRERDYEGGNSLLYALSKLTNPNKHKTTNHVLIRFGGNVIADEFHCIGHCYESCLPPRPDLSTGDIVIAITKPSANFRYKFRVQPRLAFAEVPIVGGAPILAVLIKLTGVAQRIVLGIEAETDRLLRGRSTR
jgi:hypothetical protein